MIQTIQTWFLAHWLTYSLIAAVFALNLIVSRKSQIDAWCEANPRTAGIMKAFRAIGFDPWMLVQGILLILTKKLPTNYKVLTATTKFELGPVVIAAQKADTAAIVQKAFDKDEPKHQAAIDASVATFGGDVASTAAAVKASLVYPTPDNPEGMKSSKEQSWNKPIDEAFPPMNADGTRKETP